MPEYLYDNDLRQMKYAILISTRHDRVVRNLAARLDLNVQTMRKCLIERLDMIHLENLPARYEAFVTRFPEGNTSQNALKTGLYTRYIPVLGEPERQEILEKLEGLEKNELLRNRILEEERRLIREAICP